MRGIMSAIDDIAAERKRQIEVEGWTAHHDNEHDDDEMAKAAALYALPPALRILRVNPAQNLLSYVWPWDTKWWKPKDRRRDLVRAGALIAAEIDRLDRNHGG
jgi:hypothetical protein